MYQRFATESDYRAALLNVIGTAQSTIRILDHDLQRMWLHTRESSEILTAFLSGNQERKMDIAVHDFSYMQKNAPRLLHLCERYPHAFRISLVPKTLQHLADSHLLADMRHGVRRFHRDFPRGSLLIDATEEVMPWWRRFDEIWELCQPLDGQNKAGL